MDAPTETQAPDLTTRYSRWVVAQRWPLLILCVLLTLVAGSGMRFLAFDNDYRVFFGKDNPQLLAFEAVQRTYTKVDNILFAIIPDSGDAFSPEVLAAVEELTAESWLLPYALRVDSISNFQHTVAEEDDLIVGDLVVGGADLSTDELAEIKQIALADATLVNRLIKPEAYVTGVNVTFQLPGKDVNEVPDSVSAARELAERIEAQYPLSIRLSGVSMLNNAFQESSILDMQTMIPLMYLIIILAVLVLIRSVSATIGTVLLLLMSIITAMGIAGWMGIKLTPPSSAAPTIISTLAVADSVHLLTTLMMLMSTGLAKRAAIAESLRVNLSPIFLTSITTAVGFLSLNFSDSPPFHDLGNITAIGVMAAFVYSVVFLPAFLAIMPVKAQPVTSRFSGLLVRFGDFVAAKRKSLLIGFSAISLAILAFIPQIELNDNFLKYFDSSVEFRQDADYTNANLTGIFQVQYSLNSGSANGISDPQFLQEADAFVQWWRAQPEVLHVSSITDTFKRLNKNMHADDDAWHKLPDQRDLAAQYLLLYELSLPYGLDLNNQLNIDKSSTQIVITLQDMTSMELRDMALKGESWLQANTSNLQAVGVSPSVMFAYISERNIKSMLRGTFLALVIISLILLVALRSVKMGFISLIPNLLPSALAFGIWGAAVGQVNMAVSVVVGMSLGIVVDDTVHFLSKYLRARREQGMDSFGALRYTFENVGVAILVTTIILVAGFMVLAQSIFGVNSVMALLTSIAITAALITDFILLPILLSYWDKKQTKAQT